MTKIDIGTKIDLEKLIDSRLLIQSNSGGGKSIIVRNILEQSHDKVMFIVLDIEGEYYTLREKYDVILIGGKNGDIPISLKAAKLLPKKILESQVSTVIDLSDLQMSDRIRYVKDFLESMMELPKEFWLPCLVVLEEAHKFAGQQEKQDSTWAVIDLMTRGRKRGYGGILVTQRISKLHKDAAAECNNKFVGRTFLDIDMKRASEEL
jgi:DNA helicase HerA-like ATPase